MPDPVLFAKSVAAAAVVGIVVTLAVAVAFAKLQRLIWKQSAPAATRMGVAVVLGVIVGAAFGFYVLGDLPPRSLEGSFPHWSVSNVLDRFLVVILPLAGWVELHGAFTIVPRWFVWILRLGLAAATGRVLLHGSSYLQGTASEWSVSQVWIALGVGSFLLAAVWILLVLLSRRRPGISLPLALSETCLAAGMTVMLSGYLEGGAVGLPLAGAVAATVLAARLLERMPATEGAVGLGLVSLFSIGIMGRFFGDLSTGRALALFVAPLLCWVSELPPLRARPPWVIGTVRLVVVAIPLAIVLGLAKHDFDRDMAEPYAAAMSRAREVMSETTSRKDAKSQRKKHNVRMPLRQSA
jgi:hypothetical protein